jgi:hypothetical protein
MLPEREFFLCKLGNSESNNEVSANTEGRCRSECAPQEEGKVGFVIKRGSYAKVERHSECQKAHDDIGAGESSHTRSDFASLKSTLGRINPDIFFDRSW